MISSSTSQEWCVLAETSLYLPELTTSFVFRRVGTRVPFIPPYRTPSLVLVSFCQSSPCLRVCLRTRVPSLLGSLCSRFVSCDSQVRWAQLRYQNFRFALASSITDGMLARMVCFRSTSRKLIVLTTFVDSRSPLLNAHYTNASYPSYSFHSISRPSRQNRLPSNTSDFVVMLYVPFSDFRSSCGLTSTLLYLHGSMVQRFELLTYLETLPGATGCRAASIAADVFRFVSSCTNLHHIADMLSSHLKIELNSEATNSMSDNSLMGRDGRPTNTLEQGMSLAVLFVSHCSRNQRADDTGFNNLILLSSQTRRYKELFACCKVSEHDGAISTHLTRPRSPVVVLV